ncbi:2137_t:CDS:2 [Entrophospora sp. SA101]|nr:2137_t:CDS:2 [Entrophospora sp. SA101]
MKYITDLWNYFDLGAYSLPIVTSILLLYYGSSTTVLVSLSNLLLDLKFMLFLRALTYFGRYFAIILGVAKKVDYTLDLPDFRDGDPNSPWNLASKYFTYFASNNSYDQNSIIVQQPDGNTNMFAHFPTSMLAMYNFLTSDNGAFGSWQLQDEPYLTILFIAFSFVVVVYLMNLFIGLLSNQIEKYDINEAFLAQKAKILTEIELFYLLPNQRRWREWFPDILYYYAPIEEIEKRIREIDNSNEDPEFLPFISEELRKLVDIPKPDSVDIKEIEKNLKNDLEEIKNDLANDHKEIEKRLKNDLEGLKNDLKNGLEEIKNKLKHNEQMLQALLEK